MKPDGFESAISSFDDKYDFVSFAISSFIFWMLCENKTSAYFSGDDVTVRFKPYERELRQALLRHSAGELHLVDNYLKKYRGRAKEIITFVEKYKRLPKAEEYS